MELQIYALGLVLSWWTLLRVRSARMRQLVLLAISYCLYLTWGKWFLGVLLLSSLVNYGLGLFLRRRPTAARLWLGILFNFLLLGTFKYLPSLAAVAHADSILANWRNLLMPLGLSFWTFEALSYLFEVYQEGDLAPSLLEFLLFMAFWPTVISGPICRLSEMLPQFRNEQSPTWKDIPTGMRRIAIGLVMLAVARIEGAGLAPGQGVSAGFARAGGGWSGIDVWFLAIGYGFQVFLDFAGYTHLVIGAARMCGFTLPENFLRPYLSTSPSMFWTRWHMSLSFWIRDYVFVPLASVRRNLWWRNLCLVISMVLFGLWHKGSLLFLIWGAYHGVLLVLHRQWQHVRTRLRLNVSERLLTGVGWLLSFAAINLGWIFFRAQSWTQASAMLGAALRPAGYLHAHLPRHYYLLTATIVAGYFVVVALMGVMDRMSLSTPVALLWREKWVWMTPVIAALGFYGYLLTQLQQSRLNAPFLYQLF